VELKLERLCRNCPDGAGLNRTRVELKLHVPRTAANRPASLNRTRVELKHCFRFSGCSPGYWFESNQSGIETSGLRKCWVRWFGLNRTRVELKPRDIQWRAHLPGLGLNRTRVELKPGERFRCKNRLHRLNRTRVELKLRAHYSRRVHGSRLNRTRVELKQTKLDIIPTRFTSLNRTRVELKH